MMSSTTSLPSRQEEEASTSTKGTNPSLLPASSYTAHNSNKPLSITLNGNKLALSSKGRWELESSDLDVAVLEIERLLHDKEQLSKALAQSVQQVEDLSQEIREINQMKSVVLEMLMAEREKRIELESQVDGYKQELKDSYRVIVEMRKLLPIDE